MSIFAKQKARVKRSVDLSEDTDRLLDRFRSVAEEHGNSLSRGAALDSTTGVVLRLSPSQAYGFRAEADRQLEAAQTLLNMTDPKNKLLYRKAQEDVENLRLIDELFALLAGNYAEPSPMRVVEMYQRRLFIPDAEDWVLINSENAPESSKATIVEVQNGARFGARHYVFFDNGETAPKYIDRAIRAKCPEYEKILLAKVEPVRDANGSYLNIEQLRNAPSIGYFPARDDIPASEAPYGVVIIHDDEGDNPQN